MKIKVIDLLVKMGKDKNYKPTFKYKNSIYQYDFATKYYMPSFMGLYKIYMILNDYVEILEEPKKIEKLAKDITDNACATIDQRTIANKINELIDEINNLKEND